MRCKRQWRCAATLRTFMAPRLVLFEALEEPFVAFAGEDTASQGAHTAFQRLMPRVAELLPYDLATQRTRAPPGGLAPLAESTGTPGSRRFVWSRDHRTPKAPFALHACIVLLAAGVHGVAWLHLQEDTGGLVAAACSGASPAWRPRRIMLKCSTSCCWRLSACAKEKR